MPLYDTGIHRDTFEGPRALAEDQDGNKVTVAPSEEFIQDYGWGEVFEIASRKYDAGEVQKTSSATIVKVLTTDRR